MQAEGGKGTLTLRSAAASVVIRRRSPGDPIDGKTGCPDIWEMSNGDVAVIGRDLTDAYVGRLPDGVTVVADERHVVIPRATIVAAKKDIPDA